MIISFFNLIRGRDRAGYFGTKYGKAKGRLCPWGLRGIKDSGRFLHRDRPLANIYVNNQKGSFRSCILKIHTLYSPTPERRKGTQNSAGRRRR